MTRCGVQEHFIDSYLSLIPPQAEDFRPERMLDGRFEALPVRLIL